MRVKQPDLALLVAIAVFFGAISVRAEPDKTATPRADDAEHNGGVGMAISVDPMGHFVIMTVVPGTSAAKAEIVAGDIITAVDDVAVQGLTLDALVAKIRGKLGSTVKVSMLHGEKKRDLNLARAAILATKQKPKIELTPESTEQNAAKDGGAPR